MKKFLLLRTVYCLLFVLVPALGARAQAVSPWFRGSTQAWKTLTQKSFSAAQLSNIRLIRPLSGLNTGYTVKTTVPNWITYRLSHSGTFSRMEKDILKSPGAVTGKLTYFWDRDALLAASAGPEELNPRAFTRHQELLQNTLAEVEDFSRETVANQFSNAIFSREEIHALLKDPAQPPAFVLTRREIETFPALTLDEQRTLALQAWQSASALLAQLLQKDPQTISNRDFSDYYYFKLRQRYFHLLYDTLQRAQSPRKTAVIRIRKKIELDFLPESEQFLTDAQRLGKLQFHLDRMQAQGAEAKYLVSLKTEITRQEELYRSYALAEAFNIPYEDVLSWRVFQADLYFEKEEAARLNLLTSPQAVMELPEKIARVQERRHNLLAKQNESVEGYVRYFRLRAQEEYLQMRLSRAQFFLQYTQ